LILIVDFAFLAVTYLSADATTTLCFPTFNLLVKILAIPFALVLAVKVFAFLPVYTLILTLTPLITFLVFLFLTVTLKYFLAPFLAVNFLGVNLAGAFLITIFDVTSLAVKSFESAPDTTTL
jgi:hypothetical protein